MSKILRFALGLAHTVIESVRIKESCIVVDVRPSLPGRRLGDPAAEGFPA